MTKPRTIETPHVRGEDAVNLGFPLRWLGKTPAKSTCVRGEDFTAGSGGIKHPHVHGGRPAQSKNTPRGRYRYETPHVRGESSTLPAQTPPPGSNRGETPRAWGTRPNTPPAGVQTSKHPTCVGRPPNTSHLREGRGLPPIPRAWGNRRRLKPHVRGGTPGRRGQWPAYCEPC